MECLYFYSIKLTWSPLLLLLSYIKKRQLKKNYYGSAIGQRWSTEVRPTVWLRLAFYLGSVLNMMTICLKHKWCCLLLWGTHPLIVWLFSILQILQHYRCVSFSSALWILREKHLIKWNKKMAYTVDGNPGKGWKTRQVTQSECKTSLMDQVG